MIYYFLKEGKDEIGPLTFEQLKRSSIKKETPVWFAGLGEWTVAEEVYELKELFILQPERSRFSNSRLAKIWNNLFKKRKSLTTYQMMQKKESKIA